MLISGSTVVVEMRLEAFAVLSGGLLPKAHTELCSTNMSQSVNQFKLTLLERQQLALVLKQDGLPRCKCKIAKTSDTYNSNAARK